MGSVVGPLMVMELAGGVGWLLLQPTSQWAWISLALMAVNWASTALIQMPLHQKLGGGRDAVLLIKLARSNWIRTIAWTLRGFLLGVEIVG